MNEALALNQITQTDNRRKCSPLSLASLPMQNSIEAFAVRYHSVFNNRRLKIDRITSKSTWVSL